MALRVAKSWYVDLELGLLVAQCAGHEAELAAVEDELLVRASDLASFAPWDEYAFERRADGSLVLEGRWQRRQDGS